MDPLTKLLKDIVPGLNDMPAGYKTFGGDDYAAQVRVSPSPDPYSPDPDPNPNP